MTPTFFQTLRLIWIDAVLWEEGEIQRRDICRHFDLSITQASLDLRLYQQLHPGRIAYYYSDKIYRTVEGTMPFYSWGAKVATLELVEYIRKVRAP